MAESRENPAASGHAQSSGAGSWLVPTSQVPPFLRDCSIRNQIKYTKAGQERYHTKK